MMRRAPGIIVFTLLCIAYLAFGAAPAAMAQTHSISGKIVVEGRESHEGVVVWVDSLRAAETNSLGDYLIAGFDDGTYAVMAWMEHCLVLLVDSVRISGGDVTGVNDTLFAGDVVEDGRLNLFDAGEILSRLHAIPGGALWDESCDLDRSGVIDSLDLAALMGHWKETAAGEPPSRIEVTEPAAATFWTHGQQDVSISWLAGDAQGTVSIVLYRGAIPADTVAAAAPNSGSWSGYDVPVDLMPGTSYRIMVRISATNYGYSEFFEIKGAILVTLPDSSTAWSPDEPDVPILWTTGGLDGPVAIALYKGINLVQEIASSTPNDGGYEYQVPENFIPGKDYRVQVIHIDSGVFGYSEYFEVKAGNIVVTEPTGLTVWNRGQTGVPVTWKTGNLGGNVSIRLYKGPNWLSYLYWSVGSPNDGSQPVDVPAAIPLGSDYRIQVYLDDAHNDFSEYFSIQDTGVVVTAPDTNTAWMQGQQNAAIRWESSLLTGSVSIDLYRGGVLVESVVSSTPNDGEYSGYNVPAALAPGSGYQIRVASDDGRTDLGESFEIVDRLGWIWLYPSAGGYRLNSVCFSDANTGTAVGEYGTILRTTDGGATWVKQWGSTRKELFGVAFRDASNGFAVGVNGLILKTTDGGATWVGKASMVRISLRSVTFADADTVVAVGGSGAGAVFCRSTDGGETWASVVTNTCTAPVSISFSDAKNGAALAECGAVYWTNNGGVTWKLKLNVWGSVTDYGDKAGGIAVLDANTWVIAVVKGYILNTYYGKILRTTDAGATWTTVFSGDVLPKSVSFGTAMTGTVVGASGKILRTTNGGATWTPQTSRTDSDLYGVSFIGAGAGTAVGEYGRIIRTTDGGATWSPPSPWTSIPLRGIAFTDANNGTVIGGRGYVGTYESPPDEEDMPAGIILRTSDAGATWLPDTTAVRPLNDICMADADTGTIVGGYTYPASPYDWRSLGVILRTTDGGATWVKQSSPQLNLHCVWLTNPNTGIAFATNTDASGELVLRTQDGGATWVSESFAFRINDIWFSDASIGTAVGASGCVLRTTDGGATWMPQTSGSTSDLASVQFLDANTGTVVGNGGTILRTVNGGAAWSPQMSGTITNLMSVRFVDANTGFVVGEGGTILRTTDGGAAWTKQASGTTGSFYAIHLFDPGTAIVVGEGGAILKTTTGGE